MPASKDLFTPDKGDRFSRSTSGLAYSDREIQEMLEWIEECDQSLLEVFSVLTGCLQTATNCMAPVRPEGRSRGLSDPMTAIHLHERKMQNVKNALEKLSRLGNFPKVQFYERHFIPSGGMPSGLAPRDFDESRNDERVYDEARAAAIAKSIAGKNKAENDRDKKKAKPNANKTQE